MNIVLCNGVQPKPTTCARWRCVNYGHFTVDAGARPRGTQGIDLHLQRLRDATRELFDSRTR